MRRPLGHGPGRHEPGAPPPAGYRMAGQERAAWVQRTCRRVESYVRYLTRMGRALRHVRFGSKADICGAKQHVRFTPNSGHVQCISSCLLCAKSGHGRQTIEPRPSRCPAAPTFCRRALFPDRKGGTVKSISCRALCKTQFVSLPVSALGPK